MFAETEKGVDITCVWNIAYTFLHETSAPVSKFAICWAEAEKYFKKILKNPLSDALLDERKDKNQVQYAESWLPPIKILNLRPITHKFN